MADSSPSALDTAPAFDDGGAGHDDARIPNAAIQRGEQSDSLAIIGMACRFPGGIDGPSTFWDVLFDGRVVVGEIPRERWDEDAVDGGQATTAGSRWGGFLEDVGHFDAKFFGI